jgi:hypothetical protein
LISHDVAATAEPDHVTEYPEPETDMDTDVGAVGAIYY